MRKTNTLIALLAILTLWVSAREVRAETRAVVVGISQYSSKPHLPGAAPDAEDIRNAFAARGIADVELLMNSNANRSRLESAVNDRIAKSRPGDIVVLTFAGHGSWFVDPETTKSNKSFLLADYDERQRPLERFTNEDLKTWSRELEAKKAFLVAVLDACHSGIGLRNLPPAGRPLLASRFVAPSSGDSSLVGLSTPKAS